MRPNQIFSVLDVAVKIAETGGKFNPMFEGAPGIGKSEIIQQWCKVNNYPFIDLRAAYLEAPDMIGFPFTVVKNGRQVTTHATPDFWPSIDSEHPKGVIFVDEINRGNTSVLNTFMQVLTDRKVHHHVLPKGWLIVSAVNPEGSGNNDVTTMDDAFRNRFSLFKVDFDKNALLDYMKVSEWDKTLIQFVESGLWQYSRPESVSKAPGSKYLSSRDLSYLNNVLKAGFDSRDEMMFYEAILGSNYANSFYKFKHDERPVSYNDLLTNKKAALTRLKVHGDTNNKMGAQLSVTIQSIVQDGLDITDELLIEVVLALPADMANPLIRGVQLARKTDNNLLNRIMDNSKVKSYLKDTLKGNK